MEKIIIKLKRLFKGSDSTLSVLWIDMDKPACFIVEDEQRDVKVQGETRIDAGLFQIKYREADTGLTMKYRKKFPSWFKYHLEIIGLPRHKYVYIHIGNFESNTEACLLTNYDGKMLSSGEYAGGRSTEAFKDVYLKLSAILDSGKELWIQVTDEEIT